MSFEDNLDNVNLMDGEFYDNATLIQQVNIYKLEYYKVLEHNSQLKKKIGDLEEELYVFCEEHAQCDEHLAII